MNIKILDDLYLAEISVPRPAALEGKQLTANNHIWLFDRSGSMSGTVRDLVEDMIGKLPTLEKGDTLSVGWFSGQGEYDFILKGMQIGDKSTLDAIAIILRKYASTVGCTCFSEILRKADDVVNDLKVFNPLFSLVFFTDGYPVVSSITAETAAISAAIDRIKGKLTSVLLVGYGAYYNKELMADMASRFGGTLVHSANLTQYSDSLTEFLADSRENGGRVRVTVPTAAQSELYFSINNKTVVAYNTTGYEFDFVMPRKGKSAYYLLVDKPLDKEIVGLDQVSAQRAALAAALILAQRTKTHIALEILGALGDVALIDEVNNSFTNDEYGRVEAKIRAAISSPAKRFAKGRDTKHLPKRDCYCLIDAIAAISQDEDARFLPYSPDFEYNRIGVKTVAKPNMPVFEAADNPAVSIDTLTWNDSMLNLSFTCRIPGTVKLDKDAKKFGFSNSYPTFIWRSYSVVKDGSANVATMPLIISKEVFDELQKNGVINIDQAWVKDQPSMLHFDRIPVMNRSIADGKTSAVGMSRKAIEELKYKFQINALKKIKASLETKGAVDLGAAAILTKEQIAYLEKFYIGRNGFQVPAETAPPTDSYDAKEFTIKIASFSGIPKITDVEAKQQKILQENGKGKAKLTPSEGLMVETLKTIDASCGRKSLTAVNATLAITNANLRRIRKEIQKTKFAVLMGKRWFDEFANQDRECATIEVDGYSLQFGLRMVKVAI